MDSRAFTKSETVENPEMRVTVRVHTFTETYDHLQSLFSFLRSFFLEYLFIKLTIFLNRGVPKIFSLLYINTTK